MAAPSESLFPGAAGSKRGTADGSPKSFEAGAEARANARLAAVAADEEDSFVLQGGADFGQGAPIGIGLGALEIGQGLDGEPAKLAQPGLGKPQQAARGTALLGGQRLADPGNTIIIL